MGPSSGATPLHNLTVSRRQDSRSAALEGIITAVAAFATAYFTWTIWRVNGSQLAHSHRIERAYMSGGGYRAKRPVGMSAYQIPILGETGEFQFCVNNYGKTPGTLHGLGYGFCDENAIPPIPAYTILYLHSQIDPGRSGEPIARLPIPSEYARPVVYGRFYYQTIFGTHHSSGFLYRIPPNTDSESIPPPSEDYTRDQDEEIQAPPTAQSHEPKSRARWRKLRILLRAKSFSPPPR